MGEHGSCAVGGGSRGGSLCKFQMKFAQRGGTTRLLHNGGVIVQEPKCNTMMCEFQMKFAQWGGPEGGGIVQHARF